MIVSEHDTYDRTAELLRTRKKTLLIEVDKLDTAIALIIDLARPVPPPATAPLVAPIAAEQPLKTDGHDASDGAVNGNGKADGHADGKADGLAAGNGSPPFLTAGQALVAAAIEMIELAERPLSGGEIIDALKKRKHPALKRLPGGQEKHRASTYLSTAKDQVTNIQGRGYWPVGKMLAELPAATEAAT